MKALQPDDALLADTPHAKLLRGILRSGALREWRLERILEALLTLWTVDGRTGKGAEEQRHAAQLAATDWALALYLEYAKGLTDEEQVLRYDAVKTILDRRQMNLTEPTCAENSTRA